ncbi:MAG: hypothetical protein GY856_17205 [bacterium]|nr:hypothetical protein [bacterium]
MFGILKTSGCGWTRCERTQWAGHLCGTCLALRDHGGPIARLATNYDAALISVLCEAQAAALVREPHACLLRRFKATPVIAATSPATRYAASLAMLMGATKIADHLADGDSWIRHLPTVLSTLARRWRERARRLARTLEFETSELEGHAARQATREAESNRGFLFYSQPTEEAAGAAFAHTATLADRPENRDILREIGRMFGRIMVLLDSYRDREQDRRNRRFNALAEGCSESETAPAAARFFAEAHGRIRELFPKLALPKPQLARKLLVDELGTIGRKTLTAGTASASGMRSDLTGDEDEGGRERCCDGCDPGCSDGCDCCGCGDASNCCSSGDADCCGGNCCDCGGGDCGCCDCGGCDFCCCDCG